MTDSLNQEAWIHSYPLRVQFDDVDQYGIVHHPRYLVYCERARVDLMGQLGMRPGRSEFEGMGLVVLSLQVKYLQSARFLDELVVRQGCSRAGASRIQLDYTISRQEDLLVTAELVLAFVDSTGRPCRAPDSIRSGLQTMGAP